MTLLNFSAGHDIELSIQRGAPYPSEPQGARRFGLEELNLATKNFSDINLIGHGSFGEAFKGLLQDGTIVAVKKRLAAPNQVFVEEVIYSLCTYFVLLDRTRALTRKSFRLLIGINKENLYFD